MTDSYDVEELKAVLKSSERDPSLLTFIQQTNLKQRCRPNAFFSFPGTRGSMMSLPPFQKWPIQLGWSFSTWFYLEPKANAQPYLYNFKTGKNGLGYSAHFFNNCLVLTSIRVKGKGVQHCVAYEFPSQKWLHCAVTYHNKWRASEIKVYVNGQMTANIEMQWQVQTNEIFDKCFIGGSGSITTNDRAGDLNNFSGQMSAIYLFNEGLSPTQICAIHRLGPSYMGQFKYSNESQVNLPPQISKTLYDEKLASLLFCLYTPVAVDSGTLCIQLAPFRSSTSASAQNYFVSAPHAALQGETKAIISQPIYSTLQSLGCSRSLLPLLESYCNRGDFKACESLICFLCDLLESSPHWFANEIVQNNGFVIVAYSLATNSRLLLTERLLETFLNLTRTLMTTASSHGDSLLLKNLLDNILFNPSLWIYAEPNIQIKLYSYLANEFLNGTRHGSKYNMSNTTNSLPYMAYSPTAVGGGFVAQNYAASSTNADEQPKSISFEGPSIVADLLFGEMRRVSTVLQSLHSLKYYYWVVEENNINHKARNYRFRPERSELLVIRSHILKFITELMARASACPSDEIQGLINYISSCSQPDNILDVLDTLSELITKQSAPVVLALDQKQAIRVIFTLIGSSDERVCVKSLRILNLFLAHCSYKKKHDIMNPNNLFMLLGDRLRCHLPLTLPIYEALMDLVIEEDQPDRRVDDRRSKELSKKTIVNSAVVKVIATLIQEQRSIKLRQNNSLGLPAEAAAKNLDIRALFINDLWNLIVNSRENRRIILQMSVWQHWLINLINSTIEDSPLIKDQILAIFRVLLYHAVRYEFGGWRVWIDTLAIIHAKVSYDEFCRQYDQGSPNASLSELHDRRSDDESKDTTESKKETPSKVDAAKESLKDDVVAEQDDKKSVADDSPKPMNVSSISEHILNESRGIEMTEGNDESHEQVSVDEPDIVPSDNNGDKKDDDADVKADDSSESTSPETAKQAEGSLDSIDLAPSRAFRKSSVDDERAEGDTNINAQSNEVNEVSRQLSMTSIPLEDPPTPVENDSDIQASTGDHSPRNARDESNQNNDISEPRQSNGMHKAKASPAFRIPEFRWSSVLIKLLNDLMFSIECDLYHWRCSAKLANLDCPPFIPKTANQAVANQGTTSSSSTTANSSSPANQSVEKILHKPENQIYIINVVHLVSQLADNVIIAAGGLLPLLADATGGTRGGSASHSSSDTVNSVVTCEGLTMAQANSLLYRLVSIIDMVVFAATHINLSELESDKNTTSGGILRQCLRLTCTVTVKNCLVLRSLSNRITSMDVANGETNQSSVELPKDMFDGYMGCSLLSANGLFEQSALTLDNTDLIANLEYSPHQNPNTSSVPPTLPFQSSPIKDPNKLLQTIDIQRIQACIYHNGSTESRQSQFLALSSLYFISVLMVSKYRDIIEPKQRSQNKHRSASRRGSPAPSSPGVTETSPVAGESTTENHSAPAISSIEASLMNFGNMQPNTSSSDQSVPSGTTNSLTDMLTSKLENTLDTVCPLLKTIMCDFCGFLSKTLIGSHGQDLVNKEAERTFRRANTSPVELVMLLCSQEWQNTLQKNAGLAFIELINEGRVLSHGMKDHIVRVAMEADFILSRLRADDVSKHEHFGLACSESISARLDEEILVNSLISSAARRDYVLYCKFHAMMQDKNRQHYKLDVWEDDDRRKRRFVFDSWDDSKQIFYSDRSLDRGVRSAESGDQNTEKAETKRILELQKTIEMGGINDHCSPSGIVNPQNDDTNNGDDSDMDNYDEDVDEDAHSNSQHSGDGDNQPKKTQSARNHGRDHAQKSRANVAKEMSNPCSDKNIGNKTSEQLQRTIELAERGNKAVTRDHQDIAEDPETGDSKDSDNNWYYDECGSVNDFTGSIVFAAEASLVWSIYAIPGILQISTHEIHFEPNQNITEAIDALRSETASTTTRHQLSDSGYDTSCETSLQSLRCNQNDSTMEQISLRKIDLKALRYCDFLTCNGKILLSDIRAIFSRHYLLQPNALEIFMSQRTSVMFAFNDFDIVKRVVKYLPPVGVGIKYGIPQSRRASLMTPKQLFAASNMTQRWQKREIGNFQYLMFLNTISGRTFQDLNQYPVFPWILTDYESDHLDLNLPKNFRDLSKPIGALNNKRRKEFVERYQNWDSPKVPAFHYGTHYSTAAFTLNWLCRLRGVYNSSYLALQDGKYEESNRLFLSISDSWVSSLSGGQQNVKELIPEFFYLPEIFHSNLGLPEVEYPPWAKSAEEFVRMHRIALESELVSCQLHQWIDLIFGFKQRGPEAINAVNTFYYLTYQGNVNLNMIQDPSLRAAIETQIKHFGQTPSQLTNEPHPPRFSALHASPLMYSARVDEVNKVIKFPNNNPIVHISSCINNYIATAVGDTANSMGTVPGTSTPSSPSSVLTITSNNQYQIHKWIADDQSGHPFSIDPQLESHAATSSATRRQLIDIEDVCSGIQLKLSSHAKNDDNEQQQPSSNQVEEVQWPCAHYIVTLNGKYIIMGSFYDYSFRVFTTESGRLCQVIYGHRGPITCMAKSEGNALADFYLATGSQDCSLLIWSWNDRYAQVEGSGVTAVHNPLPKLSLCGHLSPVLSAMICSELGLIVSGSKNLVLVHNITSGETLLNINIKMPEIMDKTLREHRQHHTLDNSMIQRPQIMDKEKTILEASMLGDGQQKQTSSNDKASSSSALSASSSGAQSPISERLKEERLAQLKDLCHSDYYITNLQLARELAFIVCVALPPPPCRKKSRASGEYDSRGSPPALLLTFNLMGSLMDSTPISQSSASSPKLGDICVMQVTRDGEHLILNDSPVTIKIYKTFGLQPLYSYSTNDIPDVLCEDHNRVRSLALLDYKYILVGLDNGKIIIYNCDFKSLN
jgi:hypothetical protein